MRDEIEIMRVLRQPPMGKLVIEANQQRYEQLADIPDSKMQQLIKTAVGELITFVGGYQKLVDAGVAPPLTNSSHAPSSQSSTTPSPPLRPIAPSSPPPASPSSSNNIIDGINNILANKLTSTPKLKGRTIKLAQDPSGGLRIEVDGKFYERPEEIDEKEIQQLLRQSLKEWESS